MNPRQRASVAWFTLLVGVLQSGLAHATDRFDEARERFDDGDFRGALQIYQQLLQDKASPDAYYGIGLAQIQLGRPVQAFEALSKALQGQPALSQKLRDQVRLQLRELDRVLARLVIVPSGATQRVVLDGVELSELPAEGLQVTPGTHEVLAKFANGETRTVIRLAEGEAKTVTLPEAIFGTLDVRCPDAKVLVDERETHNGPGLIKAGKHRLAITGQRSTASQREVEVPANGTYAFVCSPTLPQRPAPSPLRRPLPPPSHHSPWLVAGYATLGTGLVLGAAALVVGLANEANRNEWKERKLALDAGRADPYRSVRAQQDEIDDGEAKTRKWRMASLGVGITGVVCVASGIGMALIGPSNRQQRGSGTTTERSGLSFSITGSKALATWNRTW
jgi:hypothetical protein